MTIKVKPCSIAFESEVLSKLDLMLDGVSRSRVVNEVLKYVMQSPHYIPSVVQNLKQAKTS